MKKFKISRRDLTYLCVSLLLAWIIWLVQNLSSDYKGQVAVPVTAWCNIDGHSASSSSAAVVHARCNASGYTLLRLKRRSVSSPVNVEFAPGALQHKSGELFYITSDALADYSAAIFGDARIEAYLTDTLFFRFPYQNSRRVPVAGRLELTFRPQYMALGYMTFSPDSVTVFGDPSFTDALECVYTRPVSLSDIAGPVHGSVRLDAPSGLRLSTDQVNYDMDVTRYVEIVKEARVVTRNVPAGRTLVVYPSVVRVMLRCRFPMLAASNVNPVLWIDYEDFKKSFSGKCIPRIENLPEWVINYQVEPEVFECVEIEL